MPFPKHLIKKWGKELSWKCEWCHRDWRHGWILEGHHKIPTHMGGKDTRDNFLLLCVECHELAHRKLAEADTRSANLVHARLEKTKGRWK